jgi:Pentapeptide repeats (8 copies)/TIR domain
MARRIFVSYKREHAPSEEAVRAIEQSLGQEFDILLDVNMGPGRPWSSELYRWLLDCDAGIAIVSRDANDADWCRREWTVLAARNQTAQLPVFPVHVENEIIDTGILDDLQGIHWGDDALVNLHTELKRLPTRQASAEDFLAAHHAWLRWQYHDSPVLGQEPYALADVYIETECGHLTWGEINEADPSERVDAFDPKRGGRRDLVETALELIGDATFRDVIVVQAGPGSGKSAFTLRIANELLNQGFWPVLVRFRDLRLATFPDVGELIDDAIRIGGNDDASPHAEVGIVAALRSQTHEYRGSKLCKTVLILDGWDEVSLTGNISYQAQLRDWLPRLRQYFEQRTPMIRVLLTGRPSAEVGTSGVLHKPTPILTMRPIRPEQLRQFAGCIEQRLRNPRVTGVQARWSIDVARLQPVFDQYEEWFARLEERDLRKAGSSTTEVLGNPLLAYLSLRVLAEPDVDLTSVLQRPTALYHQLIATTVRHAGKGSDTGLRDAVHRGGEKLRRLLHEVAATISILRGESVTYAELAERFDDAELPIRRDLLSGWSMDAKSTENALRELVVNFYFKGGNSALGCEFLHKSFREYLFAEGIVQALIDALEPPVQHEQPSAAEGAFALDFPPESVEFKASRRLAYLLAPQWLSREVEEHLRWLLDRAAREDPERWVAARDLVASIYGWWAEGVHLRHQPTGSKTGGRWKPPFVDSLFAQAMPFDDPKRSYVPIRTTALDSHLGRALMRLACMLHEILPQNTQPNERRARYQSVEGQAVRFQPGGMGFMRAILGRIESEGWSSTALGSLLSGPVDLSRENLHVVLGGHARVDGANLSRTRLPFAHLAGMQLSGANLQGAVLYFAYLAGADLSGADLTGADLSGADLTDADLRRANLRDADLSEAKLKRAALQGVDLSHTKILSRQLSADQKRQVTAMPSRAPGRANRTAP